MELSLCHKLNLNLIPIFLQHGGVNLSYFKLSYLIEHNLKYLRSTILGCKDMGIRKLILMAKTQFLKRKEKSKDFMCTTISQRLLTNCH